MISKAAKIISSKTNTPDCVKNLIKEKWENLPPLVDNQEKIVPFISDHVSNQKEYKLPHKTFFEKMGKKFGIKSLIFIL